MTSPTRLTAKGERTRERILECALDLFRERGYDRASMRAIAEAADVSVGNAYYYFASKEHLIQAFYGRTHTEHLAACEAVLDRETELRERLRGVLLAKIETAEPYHRFSGVLFKTAADPASPLNPFSEDSRPVREDAIRLMERVVAGSSRKVPEDLRRELPELLWMYLMGIVLFWIHDDSPERARTRRLIDRTSDLVARLIGLARSPLLLPVRKSVLRLLRELRDEAGAEHGAIRESS